MLYDYKRKHLRKELTDRMQHSLGNLYERFNIYKPYKLTYSNNDSILLDYSGFIPGHHILHSPVPQCSELQAQWH